MVNGEWWHWFSSMGNPGNPIELNQCQRKEPAFSLCSLWYIWSKSRGFFFTTKFFQKNSFIKFDLPKRRYNQDFFLTKTGTAYIHPLKLFFLSKGQIKFSPEWKWKVKSEKSLRLSAFHSQLLSHSYWVPGHMFSGICIWGTTFPLWAADERRWTRTACLPRTHPRSSVFISGLWKLFSQKKIPKIFWPGT